VLWNATTQQDPVLQRQAFRAGPCGPGPLPHTTMPRCAGDLGQVAFAQRSFEVSAVCHRRVSAVRIAPTVSAELGPPGNGMSRPTARRNKYDMVLALRDAGLAHPASILSTDVDEIIAWAETVGYPVILKPVASSSTDSVVECSSPEQVRAVHEKIMNCRDLPILQTSHPRRPCAAPGPAR
jgi:hypothetical protein